MFIVFITKRFNKMLLLPFFALCSQNAIHFSKCMNLRLIFQAATWTDLTATLRRWARVCSGAACAARSAAPRATSRPTWSRAISPAPLSTRASSAEKLFPHGTLTTYTCQESTVEMLLINSVAFYKAAYITN
jgi:hypothetical protein